jgi:predicted DCC family thiol-disulfide oxidoreductase YuxK
MRSIWLLDDKGLHNKSTAVFRMLRRLPQPWPLLYALIAIPRPIRDWAYSVCARNRYRFFPRLESCRIPTGEERAVFLP